jgi:transposase
MDHSKVTLRPLTPEERQALEQLASSRPAQARFVDRARPLTAIAAGRRPSQVARDWGGGRPPVSTWVRRFHERGLGGLEDRPRAGRPPPCTAEQRAEVVAAALTDPQRLDRPSGRWTLDRLRDYLHQPKGVPSPRGRIGEVLGDAGRKGRHQETGFGERVDPDCAEKRGPSSRSPPHRRRGAASSAATRGGRSRPRATPAQGPSTPSPDRAARARPGRPSGPSKGATTGGAARGPSSPPSARRPARRGRPPSPAAARRTGPTSWGGSRRGSRRRSSGSLPAPITGTRTGRWTCSWSPWRTPGGSSSSRRSTRPISSGSRRGGRGASR